MRPAMSRRKKERAIETGTVFARTVAEFAPRDDIMRRDSDEMHALKHAIFDALTEPERNILIAYAESESHTELARLLGVGRTTAREEVYYIRGKIIDYMREHGYDYGNNSNDD